ncbi:glycosyltransferase family 2 protein [Methylomicrobium sp. Wu6]|uniref:glycosyltransferase family 2 protein n=1 Tax=Methylomicrobium sp. Wu6 TaxID=3107928 RepID=UPI002DD6381E|nr:glycosyltransferase family 2 protein [Methylomicrobium sp. Wu6]MEC4750311.1 glycosyltransferase family 2 protein [Methylomicrobium sp. Wu6]
MNHSGRVLTVVILTKNEEKTLARCLSALPTGYDVVVLDSGSTDQTLDIAKQYGCMIRQHDWEGYAQQRNYALEECDISTPWVLFIDADEVFQKEFFDWAMTAVNLELASADAVMVPSYFFLRGKRLGYAPGYPIYHARLLRRGKVRFLSHHDGGFGENIEEGARVAFAKIPYEHYYYDGEMLEWMHKHVDHASREIRVNKAGIIINRRKRLSMWLGNSILRAPLRFIYHYIICRGFLDGRAGLEYSLMFSWYEATKYLLARYGERQT